MKQSCNPSLSRALSSLSAMLFTLLALTCGAPSAVAEASLADRSKAVASDAKEVAVEASQSVVAGAQNVWQSIEKNGLSERTQDEIVAWMIVGALVGAIAGMLTSMKSTGMGRVGRLMLGLIGAFIGGVAVRLGNLDLGWNPLQIRYEEILFAFAGAVLLVLLARLARATTQKKQA